MGVQIEIEKDGKTLQFNTSLSLDKFGEAMGHYDALIKIFEKRTGVYSDFTNWLVFMGYAEEVTPHD